MTQYYFSIQYDEPTEFDGILNRNSYIWVYDSKENMKTNGDYFAFGVARCRAGDHFKKTTGRKIALTKAIKLLSREVRTKIWEDFWNYVKSKE